MSPPPQDVLAFEGLLGETNYEAVPAGMADEVVASHRRTARKRVIYRVLGVLVVGVVATGVLFRFTRSVEVSVAVAGAFVLVVGGLQLRARDQGVPDVVARGIDPAEVRREYSVDPTEVEEMFDDEDAVTE